MRVRTRDSRASVQAGLHRHVNVGTPTEAHTEHSYDPAFLCGGLKEDTTDTVTPYYKTRRSRGEVILNNFVNVKTYGGVGFVEGPSVKLDYTGVGGGYNLYEWHSNNTLRMAPKAGTYSGNPNPYTAEELKSAAELAAAKAWADVYKSEVQLQISLLELKRTISLLLHPISNARTFLKRVKAAKDKDKTAQALTLAQYIAKEWLTYRYGWSQLYRDIRGVLKALEKDQRTGLQKAFGKYTDSRTWTESWNADYGNYNTEVLKETTQKVTCRVGIFYEADLQTRTYLGLTWYDTLATVWDIIPYSFVVDWVTNTQTYLSALLRAAAVPTKGTYVSTEVYTTSVYTPGNTTLTGGDYLTVGSVVVDASGARTERTISKERVSPAPDPALHADLKIGSLIDIRVLDGLALLTNLLGRR